MPQLLALLGIGGGAAAGAGAAGAGAAGAAGAGAGAAGAAGAGAAGTAGPSAGAGAGASAAGAGGAGTAAGIGAGGAGGLIGKIAGMVPNFLQGGGGGAGAEAAKLSALGQQVPQGVSMVGPAGEGGGALTPAEASAMFSMRPGLPSSTVEELTPPSFMQQGGGGRMQQMGDLLRFATQSADQISPLLELFQGNRRESTQQSGGASFDMQPAPSFQPAQMPAQLQEDPLAFLRAFGVQG